ncbi:MAG: Fe-S cluster assembly protein SufD, partial [Rickettsiales bacterium]
ALEMIEYTIGVPDAVYAANQVTEVYLDGAAKLNHTLIQEQSAQGAEINSRYVQAEQDSLYHSTVFTTGARVNRVETVAELLGEKAHVDVQTVQLVRDHLHSDSTTVVTHDTENATSNQHCRIVLDDAAKGAFQGKTIVARDAQKTDAHQLNKNLLLSRTATVNTKPELEIYADDVACSHGATTGELDAMALFYLQSRGVDEATARRLLVEAFADEVIETAPLAGEVRDVLRDKIARWMEQRA